LGWQALSYGDKLVLINLVLTSLPMFMLSLFKIPEGVRKTLEFFVDQDCFGKVMVASVNIG
jgi:hypothetical protein